MSIKKKGTPEKIQVIKDADLKKFGEALETLLDLDVLEVVLKKPQKNDKK
jgi:hypothetical protein